MPRKPPKGKSLAELYPKLVKEWHTTKNDDLSPLDVTKGSNKKVWWKCNKQEDHEWETTVAHRTNGTKCPFCSGNKVILSNSLATTNPDLAKQWHPNKNRELTPFDFTNGSGKKIWWKCDKGNDHEWEATISKRTSGRNCPVCTNKKVVKSNSLATLDAKLAKQWHPTKNGDLTPFDVVLGSRTKVWWKCDKGNDHEWKVEVYSRKRDGCPICAGRRVVKSNSLATTHLEIAKQWHPTKNGDLTAYDVVSGSHIKVWWKCSNSNHPDFFSNISNVCRGHGCFECGRIKIYKNKVKPIDQAESEVIRLLRKDDYTFLGWVGDYINAHSKFNYICSKNHKHSIVLNSFLSGVRCRDCADFGFNTEKNAVFYLRKIKLKDKIALKFGVTNQLGENREKQQQRKLLEKIKLETIFKTPKYKGSIILEIEKQIKFFFRDHLRYLTKVEMPDGFTETIKYSERNIKNIISIVNRFLKDENK